MAKKYTIFELEQIYKEASGAFNVNYTTTFFAYLKRGNKNGRKL